MDFSNADFKSIIDIVFILTMSIITYAVMCAYVTKQKKRGFNYAKKNLKNHYGRKW